MNLREGNKRDWPAISDISKRSGYNDYINRWGESYLDAGTVIIAEEDVPVGFSKVERLPDDSAWLSGLRVDPDHWRKGIGKMLTLRGIEIARSWGSNSARMLVEDSNVKSRALSEKMGFHNAAEYMFFTGGIDLYGFTLVDESVHDYLSMGWRMMYAGRADDIPGKFFRKGETLVFVNDQKSSFHVLSADEKLLHEGGGVTLCSESAYNGFFSELTVMDDFPRGILYEMLL